MRRLPSPGPSDGSLSDTASSDGSELIDIERPPSEVRAETPPAGENSSLYLWLFLGVPGAFIGARQSFKRGDAALGKRLVSIGVVMMIGFCLLFGFITLRITDAARELAREPSDASVQERGGGVSTVTSSEPPTATIPQGAAYAMLHPSSSGTVGDLGKATAIIKGRLDSLNIDGVAQCLGNDVLVVTSLESGIRRAENGGVFHDLPLDLQVESVQTYPPPTEGQHIGCGY